MNGGRVARGLQVGAVRPLGIRKISKTNMLISPLKNVRHYRIHVLPVLYRCGWKRLTFKRVLNIV
jgi:hypothetical protein